MLTLSVPSSKVKWTNLHAKSDQLHKAIQFADNIKFPLLLVYIKRSVTNALVNVMGDTCNMGIGR